MTAESRRGPSAGRDQPDGSKRLDTDDGRARDAITGIGYQFEDGQKIIRLERVVLAGGTEIRVYGR